MKKGCNCSASSSGPRRVTQIFAVYQVHEPAKLACDNCDTPWEEQDVIRDPKEKASFFTSRRF